MMPERAHTVLVLAAALVAAGAMISPAADLPAIFRYPDASGAGTRTSISEGRASVEEAFTHRGPAAAIHDYYRCLMDSLGWEALGHEGADAFGRAHYAHGDMLLTVVTDDRGNGEPVRAVARFSVPAPDDERAAAMRATRELHPYARATARVTHVVGNEKRNLTSFACSDPPAVFFEHLAARLAPGGWRAHSELELYKPFGLQQNTLRWFVGGERHLIAFANPGARAGWTYTLISKERMKGSHP